MLRYPTSAEDVCRVAGDFRLALILGGARSGKSRLALRLAAAKPAPRLYVATAQPGDPEMAARIERHRRERGPEWDTWEVPLHLPTALAEVPGAYQAILVDCLTMWISNVLISQQPPPEMEPVGDTWWEKPTLPPAWEERRQEWQVLCQRFFSVLASLATPLVLVSNEVGWGIVPDHPLTREFRDRVGWLHQRLAEMADLVILVAAGLPMILKGLKLTD